MGSSIVPASRRRSKATFEANPANSISGPLVSVRDGPLSYPECGYDDAQHAASVAADEYYRARQHGAGSVGLEQLEAAKEATEERRQYAKDCEERAAREADLLAQQDSARAAASGAVSARDQIKWTGAEIGALLLTIGIGVAAIVVTRMESRAQIRQAQEHFVEDKRPTLSVKVRVLRIQQYPTGVTFAVIEGMATNIGSSEATHINHHFCDAVEEFGAIEDAEFARDVVLERSRTVERGTKLAPDKGQQYDFGRFVPIPDAFFDDSKTAGTFNLAGWVRYRSKYSKAYLITPFVLFVSFMEDADDVTKFKVFQENQNTDVIAD